MEPVVAAIDMAAVMPRLRQLADQLYGSNPIPSVVPVRQRLASRRLEDIEAATSAAVERAVAATPRRGPLAVAVGSRGIANLAQVVRVAVDRLRAAGFEPFIVPAMGSHGGATPAGQAALLAHYGVDERRMGVPVRATMETRVLGEVAGVPVHWDRNAADCGQVLLVARVKPHTDFEGPIESGPAKMAAIGLGKQKGAQLMHSAGTEGLRDMMPAVARFIADRGMLLGALAIVENERDEIASLGWLPAAEIGRSGEATLLAEARRLLPRLPFGQVDVAVIDRMGKDISGTGMDSNVLNRVRITGSPEPDGLAITNVVVLDLTDDSDGNATGFGLADFIPHRLVEKVDLATVYTNILTAGLSGVERGRLPIVMPDDRFAILAAIAARGRLGSVPLRLAWFRDTLHTETMAVTEALLADPGAPADLEVLGPPRPLPFDASGRLPPLETLLD